jgi:transposase
MARVSQVSQTRRRFTPQFKLEAVRLMRERLAAGLTLERVSRELEIGPDLLRVWAQQVAAHPGARAEEIFPGPGARRARGRAAAAPAAPAAAAPETAAELRRLQREVEVLREERDFLKKAAAFFAKESR